MPEDIQTEATTIAGSDEAQQDVAQASDTKAEAATSTASDELSEDDLEAVAGGTAAFPNYRGPVAT